MIIWVKTSCDCLQRVDRNICLEFFVKFYENSLENSDRSVLIDIHPALKDKSILFFTLFNIHTDMNFNSRIVTLNPISSTNHSIDQIQITLQHRNNTDQMSTCVNLNEHLQWTSEGCRLLATNTTHSTCSCHEWTTVGLVMDFSKVCRTPMRDQQIITNVFSR